VAIADKINESARGTARAPPARARADQALEAARAESGHPDLRHAWSVFIGQPLSLPIPPDVAAEAMQAARAGDMTAAMRAVAKPVRRALEAAARAEDEGSGDVYNAGAALSEEALTAWIEAMGPRRTVRRVELDPSEVPADVAARFWFGSAPASLVVTFHPDGRPAEMFRHVGRAWFKGLGEVSIWELAADVGAPAELFRALRARWLGGAQA
jgi:Arc/MetJ family transcription regulator